jgi:2-keto-3-deoxy-L-fuconate dehydrogenase
MRRLDGLHCLVTAAAQGIGRETALRFHAEGARVLAVDIAADKLLQLAAEAPGLQTRVLDVRDAPAIARHASQCPPFDVLFNCVGFVHHGTILECDEADWRRSFELNVDSMYRVCRAFLPGMLERRRGSIINVASVASSITGAPARFAYGSTKAAVIGLTKSIAADFVAQGIRCNAICPGTVMTPSLEDRVRARPGKI